MLGQVGSCWVIVGLVGFGWLRLVEVELAWVAWLSWLGSGALLGFDWVGLGWIGVGCVFGLIELGGLGWVGFGWILLGCVGLVTAKYPWPKAPARKGKHC